MNGLNGVNGSRRPGGGQESSVRDPPTAARRRLPAGGTRVAGVRGIEGAAAGARSTVRTSAFIPARVYADGPALGQPDPRPPPTNPLRQSPIT